MNRKLVFFGTLALLWAGALVGFYVWPLGGAVLIAFSGSLLCEIMLR